MPAPPASRPPTAARRFLATTRAGRGGGRPPEPREGQEPLAVRDRPAGRREVLLPRRRPGAGPARAAARPPRRRGRRAELDTVVAGARQGRLDRLERPVRQEERA